MCGICGFTGTGTLDELQHMTAVLAHRGPDDEGLWHDAQAGLYLGHRRLAVIDLHDGAQPMWTADGRLGIVFNGEIYNHLELRAELTALGHHFRSDHSDTEVLLHGYRQWGADVVRRLNGMWAFALLDREQRRLFLSRDRFGKKPLYYCHRPGLFAFASELKSLRQHPGVPARLSPRALKKYFAYGFIPAPLSVYADILKLPGGHSATLRLDDMSLAVTQYWDFVLEPFATVPRRADEEWGEEIRRLLCLAVQRRLMADVPLGIFLSGGIDSSAVAALAAQLAGQDRVKTFSIGFEEASFDESPHAQRVAEFIGAEHHNTTLSLERARALLPEIAGRLDEPLGDSSLLPTFLLCQETRKHVTVALGGDGGDELFAGYDPFRAQRPATGYAATVPAPLHRLIRRLAERLPVSHRNFSLDFKIKRTLRGLSYPQPLWNSVWLGPLEPADLAALFGEPCEIEDVYSEALAAWADSDGRDLTDRTLLFYTRLYLQDDILVKIDRASMMHSLEVRSPFLDIDLVDFVRRIPGRLKYGHGQTKYLLKKALEPLLPRETIYRPKKGFGIPVGKWFHSGALTVDPSRHPAGLNRQFIADRAAAHRRGARDDRAFLWNEWLLENVRL